MLKTADGVPIPTMVALAANMCAELKDSQAAFTRAILVFTALQDRDPVYARKLIQEFRLWAYQNPGYFSPGVVEGLVSGGMLDEVVQQIKTMFPIEGIYD